MQPTGQPYLSGMPVSTLTTVSPPQPAEQKKDTFSEGKPLQLPVCQTLRPWLCLLRLGIGGLAENPGGVLMCRTLGCLGFGLQGRVGLGWVGLVLGWFIDCVCFVLFFICFDFWFGLVWFGLVWFFISV